jgi:N-acetylmuramoyl-L-alanine amidase
MKNILFHIVFIIVTITSFGQTIVVDAGHGWGASIGGGACANPDGRLSIEMETSHSVAHKLKKLINDDCPLPEVLLTRPNNNCNSWVSLSQRTTMANSWGADAFLSIHTNAGGGSGTETFWCAQSPTLDYDDQTFCYTVQNDMANYGDWANRRATEDDIYLSYHLYVLRYSNTYSVLSEIGFGDNTGDFAKLSSDSWRNEFALSYYESLQSFLEISCKGTCEKPIELKCGSSYSGNTNNGQLNFDAYGCNQSIPEQGKEKVHTFVVGKTSNIEITLTNLTRDLDVHLSSSCNTESCIARADNTIIYDSLPDGVYYVIVDGYGTSNPAEGDYTLNINCVPVSEGTGGYYEVYPNPFEDNFRIASLQNKSKQTSYILYDAAGNKVKEGQFTEYVKIYFNDLAQGVYLLHVSDDKTTEVKKLVKK